MYEDVTTILRNALQLDEDVYVLRRDTPLLGSIPELDSMSVVTVLTMIEEAFSITIEDDEVSAEIFDNVGSLVDFVESKVMG